VEPNLEALHILKTAYAERIARNSRYSLRSFAKALGMSHTVLSLVLSGKRPLSKKAARQVAEKLGLSPDLADLLQAPRNRAEAARPGAVPRSYRKIEIDTFHLISDWVNYAILSLAEIPGEEMSPARIAKRLSVDPVHVRNCLETLTDLELLRPEAGTLKLTGNPIRVENKVSTAGTRKLQRQLLEKAVDSLENDPFEMRDLSSITMAIDPKHVDYARERIRQFRRELCEELEAKGAPTEVYNLTVQIFPVSKVVKS